MKYARIFVILHPIYEKCVLYFATMFHQNEIQNEILRRRDMRDVFTFTIDPADAKDFDDALSFAEVEDDRDHEITGSRDHRTPYTVHRTPLRRRRRPQWPRTPPYALRARNNTTLF